MAHVAADLFAPSSVGVPAVTFVAVCLVLVGEVGVAIVSALVPVLFQFSQWHRHYRNLRTLPPSHICLLSVC